MKGGIIAPALILIVAILGFAGFLYYLFDSSGVGFNDLMTGRIISDAVKEKASLESTAKTTTPTSTQTTTQTNTQTQEPEMVIESVARFKFEGKDVSVNGNVITSAEVENRYNELVEEAQGAQTFTKDDILESLIVRELLLQEAKAREVDVSQENSDKDLQLALEENEMTEQDLVDILAESGLTLEEYKVIYREQNIILALINQAIDTSKTEVSDEEVDMYIEENSDLFGGVDFNDTETMAYVKEMIKSQLSQMKQQQLTEVFVDELIEKAEIKTL